MLDIFYLCFLGLVQSHGRAAQSIGTALVLDSPPAECGFIGFHCPWGHHRSGVVSGVTLSLVLHHQNSLLTGTFGPGACFNGCFACLKAANLFFGCFCDALGMLGRVVSSACNGQSSISVSRGALGAHGISRLVPLCSRMLSAPWGPTFHGLWASFGWEMAKMAMFWSGNAAVTLSIKPTHTFC